MKVTYLFGAGASRNALPIVNEIPVRIHSVIELLEREDMQLSDIEKYSDYQISISKKEVQAKLIEDLRWLLSNSENHASIDTFAKKLYIRGNEEDLKRLKVSFSAYLAIEQIIRSADIRYDSFFASILNDNYYDFPSNVRILSWNYDVQFEKAFVEYSGQNECSTNQSLLNVVTKFTRARISKNGFCILKLNGTSNVVDEYGSRHYNFTPHFQNELSHSLLDSIVKNYSSLMLAKNIRVYSGLSFAWERYQSDQNDIINMAKKETNDTDILIVIGYSFPYFNREIDREIIKNMNSLSRVYFQSPDAEIIRERFLSIRNDIESQKLLVRHDVGQFLLPNEL